MTSGSPGLSIARQEPPDYKSMSAWQRDKILGIRNLQDENEHSHRPFAQQNCLLPTCGIGWHFHAVMPTVPPKKIQPGRWLSGIVESPSCWFELFSKP